MGLLGNYSVLNKNPGRALGGSTVSDTRASFNKAGAERNKYAGFEDLAFSEYSAVPNGYIPPYSWVIAPKSGGMASYTIIGGEGDLNFANLAGGLNGEAALTGLGIILSADATGIASVVAVLSGLGTFTSDIYATLELASSLAGSGDLTGALGALSGAVSAISGIGTLNGDIFASLDLSIALAGSGDVTGSLGALSSAVASILASATVTASIAGALSASSSLAGTGDITGALGALSDAVATIIGTSSLDASLVGGIQAAASLSGTTSLTASLNAIGNVVSALIGAATIDATTQAAIIGTANLVGTGTLTASVNGLADLIQTLMGVGTVTAADLRGKGIMTAAVTPFSELSPESLAAAVWNALASEFNSSGSMGEKMNASGGIDLTTQNRIILIEKILRNKMVTNPSDGTLTIYDDDGSTVLLQGDLFEDAPGTQSYQGQGAERRERLED